MDALMAHMSGHKAPVASRSSSQPSTSSPSPMPGTSPVGLPYISMGRASGEVHAQQQQHQVRTAWKLPECVH